MMMMCAIIISEREFIINHIIISDMVTFNLSISIFLLECIISLTYGFNPLLNLKGRTLLSKFHLYSADSSIIDKKKILVLGLKCFFLS